jgi:hypothetical protein
MAKHFQTLLATVLGDGARPAKFMVNICNIPGEIQKNTQENISVLCKGAIFPGKSLTTIPFEYKGRTIQVPSHVKYEQTFELSFYLEETHKLRILFMDWIQGFDKSYESYYTGSGTSSKTTGNDINIGSKLTESIRDFKTEKEKMTSIKVSQLDFDLKLKTAEYIFHNCYPTQVSSVTVDSSQVGAILEYSVTFAYSHLLVYNAENDKYNFSQEK